MAKTSSQKEGIWGIRVPEGGGSVAIMVGTCGSKRQIAWLKQPLRAHISRKARCRESRLKRAKSFSAPNLPPVTYLQQDHTS